MKKMDVGQIVNALASLGVLAGLIFVGLQLQLDRDFAERTLLFDATESRSQWAEHVRESGDVWIKGLAAEGGGVPAARRARQPMNSVAGSSR